MHKTDLLDFQRENNERPRYPNFLLFGQTLIRGDGLFDLGDKVVQQ